jgi:hypothetical protein
VNVYSVTKLNLTVLGLVGLHGQVVLNLVALELGRGLEIVLEMELLWRLIDVKVMILSKVIVIITHVPI